MRYLLVILLVLVAIAANAASATPSEAGSCLKFPSAIETGCISVPDAAAFPKQCSFGLALPAVAACTKVIESGPAAFRVWGYFFRGLANGYVRRLDDAVRDYTAVLAEKPDFLPALVGRGSCYTALKNYDAARKDIEKALNIDSGSFDALTTLFLLEAAAGNTELASATLQMAIGTTPQTANGYYSRGFFILKHFNDDAEAEADFTSALQLQPDHADALLNRSEIYARTGRMELAEKDCNTGISLKIAPEDIHFCFAMMFFITGHYPDALREFRAVLALRPDNDFVWNNCASIELLNGKYAEALADLNQAIAVNPAEVSSYINRGIAHRHLGRIDLALADYGKAIELSPGNESAYVNRGALYLANKDFERAEADFAMAVSLKPDDVNAQRGLEHARLKQSLPPGMNSTVVH